MLFVPELDVDVARQKLRCCDINMTQAGKEANQPRGIHVLLQNFGWGAWLYSPDPILGKHLPWFSGSFFQPTRSLKLISLRPCFYNPYPGFGEILTGRFRSDFRTKTAQKPYPLTAAHTVVLAYCYQGNGCAKQSHRYQGTAWEGGGGRGEGGGGRGEGGGGEGGASGW